jgi:hypothetical protein
LTFTEDLKKVCFATPKSEIFTEFHALFFREKLEPVSLNMILMENQCSASFPGDAPEGPPHLGAGEIGNTGRK